MDHRSGILEAALDLFTARGYEGCGVQEICLAAGITKPTLYHYFGSKRGLLETLLERDYPPLERSLAAACDYRGDLPLTLERAARCLFDFARDRPSYYRLLLNLYFAPPQSEGHQAGAPRLAGLQTALEGVFTAAVNEHGNIRGDERLLAATFLGMAHTCIGLYLNGRASLDDETLRRVLRRFQYGIYT